MKKRALRDHDGLLVRVVLDTRLPAAGCHADALFRWQGRNVKEVERYRIRCEDPAMWNPYYVIGAEPDRTTAEARRMQALARIDRIVAGRYSPDLLIGARLGKSGWDITFFESPAALETWWFAQLADVNTPYAARFTYHPQYQQLLPTHERSRGVGDMRTR